MSHWDDSTPFFSLRLWRALWRDDTALDRSEHWMNLIEPSFRSERFHSLGASDFFQLGGVTVVLLLLGPVLVVLLVLGAVLSGAVRGALTASTVSRQLINLRTARRLELLSMTPGGVFQACWAMVVYYHYRKEPQHPIAGIVQGAQHVLSVALGLGMSMLALGGLLTFLSGGFSRLTESAGQDLLRGGMVTGAILLALRYDTAVSPLIGAAVGLWGGSSAGRQLDGRLWAMTVYSVIQVILLVGGGALWIVLTLVLSLEFWASYWLLIAIFFLGHEAALRWAWVRACDALDIPYRTVASFKRMGIGVQSSAIKLYQRG
jgi:hypothetical protein